jgi:hypothetical protein
MEIEYWMYTEARDVSGFPELLWDMSRRFGSDDRPQYRYQDYTVDRTPHYEMQICARRVLGAGSNTAYFDMEAAGCKYEDTIQSLSLPEMPCCTFAPRAST